MNGRAAHTPARLSFRVLGPREVDGPDGHPLGLCNGKPATVLTLLLLHRNAWVSTEQLVDAVWANRDVPASAQNNLKTYVWQLRRSLPEARTQALGELLTRFDDVYDGLPGPAQRLYQLIAMTPRFDLRQAARVTGTDRADVELMVDVLMDHNLVTEPAPGRFEVSPVVRDHASQVLIATGPKAELVA